MKDACISNILILVIFYLDIQIVYDINVYKIDEGEGKS